MSALIHEFRLQAIIDTETGEEAAFEVLNKKPYIFIFADANFILDADIQAMNFALDLAKRTSITTHFNLEPQSLIRLPTEEIQKTSGKVVMEIVERGLSKLDKNELDTLANKALALRKAGYLIAMDDVSWTEAEWYLFKLVEPDFIKTVDWKSLSTARNFAGQSQVIAEMVENETLAKVAKTLGADYMQGFFFDNPKDVLTQPAESVAGEDVKFLSLAGLAAATGL